MTNMISPIQAASITSSTGLIINGQAWGGFGKVASAGDINGDGVNDIIIGALNASSSNGAAYVIYGGSSLSSPITASSISQAQGLIINGLADSWLGYSVAAAGDVNGDGVADIIVGADQVNSGAGAAYVIYGGSSLSSPITASSISQAQGLIINGPAASTFGNSVAGAGDFNADGVDDIIVGAAWANVYNGAAYIIYGGKNLASPIDAASITSRSGLVISGLSRDSDLGASVAAAGDVNGDGVSDIIIGADGFNNASGVAYVIYGGNSLTSPIDVSRITSVNGLIINAPARSQLGFSVASVGDVNNDGIGDIIVGAILTSIAYVIYGGKSLISPIDVSCITSESGLIIDGSCCALGGSVAGAGDVNGDGKDDIIVGNYATSGYAGVAYVIYGGSNITSPIDLSSITSASGIIVFGSVGDYFGGSVASAGDFNGDGVNDIIVGSGGVGWPEKCTAYVIYGFKGIDLERLKGSEGSKILGASVSDQSGGSVSGISDINGDGISDVLVSVDHASPLGCTSAGEVYVIYGKKGGYSQDIEFSQFNSTLGFKIIGGNSTENSDWSVGSAGDINADNITDIVIGINKASPLVNRPSAGEAYVIYGRKDGAFKDIDLNIPLHRVDGFKVLGISSGDLTGIAVAGNFDLNFDGISDIAIGASGVSALDRENAGVVYVLYGLKGGYSTIDLSTTFNEYGFKILGANGQDGLGSAVSGGFDINADGIDDIIIGASNASPLGRSQAGEAYVIYGKKDKYTDVDLANLQVDHGFKIIGANSNDLTGGKLSNAGDINGDSLTDVLISAPNASPLGRPHTGIAYVIYGKKGRSSDIDLASFTSSMGFRILGENSGDLSGSSVSNIGDINKDGFDDVLIGAKNASYLNPDRIGAGLSYVVYGKKDGYANDVQLKSLDALVGESAGDASGSSVSGGVDLNGDGIPDIIISAPKASPLDRNSAGEIYVIYGGKLFNNSIDLDLSGQRASVNNEINILD